MAGTKKVKRERIPDPPDGGYGWVVLISCFLISLIIDGCMYSFGIVLGDIKTDFGVSQKNGPIVSGLTTQFGIRPVVMGGAVITAFCYVITAYAPSIYLSMVFYGVIGGVSTGCTYIASLIIVAQYFDRLQGIATGVTMAGSGVGAFVFAKFSGILLENFGWKFTMIILGSIICECCLLGALLRPVPTKPKPKEIKDDNLNVPAFTMGSVLSLSRSRTEIDDSDSSACARFGKMALNILKEMTNLSLLKENIGFLLITLSNFIIFAGYFLPFIYIPIITKELGIFDTFYLGLIGLINIPARLAFGFLADARYLSPVNLNTLSVIVATGSLWAYPFLNTKILQLAFSTVFAIGIAGMNCLTTPYLKDIVGMDKFSNAMGIINLFRGFGCFIGPFIGGYISDITGKSMSAMYYSSITFTIGTVLAILLSFGSKCGLFKAPKSEYSPARQTEA